MICTRQIIAEIDAKHRARSQDALEDNQLSPIPPGSTKAEREIASATVS